MAAPLARVAGTTRTVVARADRGNYPVVTFRDADGDGHEYLPSVVALSGGYTREEANARLARNKGVIASFSRALTEGLSVDQSDEEFDRALDAAIQSIYEASAA